MSAVDSKAPAQTQPGRLQSSNAGILNFSPAVSGIDAQRIVAVLEKAVERLELLRVLNYESATEALAFGGTANGTAAGGSTTDGGMAKGSTAAAVNTSASGAAAPARGIGTLLDEQRWLEQRYADLLQATHTERRNPREPAMDNACFSHVRDEDREERLAELREVSRRLKDQSRALCRQLKENPNDAHNWRKVVTERDEIIKLLMACITELQTSAQQAADQQQAASAASAAAGGSAKASGGGAIVASFEGFARKILDEQSAAHWADALVKKEKETNQNVKQLQNEVRQERALKEQELEQCHAQLTLLKAELRHLRRATKEQADRMRAETEAASEAHERRAHEEQRVTNNAIADTLHGVETEQQAHTSFVSHTEARVSGLERRAGEWSSHIEREQRSLEENKHDVERRRQDAADILRQRSEELTRAEDARRRREQEREQSAAEKADREARKHARYCASTKLQAALKGMLTRQALVGLKKKAAKKKKAAPAPAV